MLSNKPCIRFLSALVPAGLFEIFWSGVSAIQHQQKIDAIRNFSFPILLTICQTEEDQYRKDGREPTQ